MKRKNSKKIKKPSGDSGYVNITDRGFTIEKIVYPENKEDLEDYILKRFIYNLKSNKTNIYNLKENPIRNDENDFDYTLNTFDGIEYLDLMEIFVNLGKGGFESASYKRNYGEFTDSLIQNIMKKSSKYQGVKSNKHLLVYPTDWRFRCGDPIIILTSYILSQIKHSFESIYYFVLDDNINGEIKKLFPYKSDYFNDFNDRIIRTKSSIVFNPKKTTIENDGSVSIPLGD